MEKINSTRGIAHRGGTNPLNFSYDLLEPLRPFVDAIVYRRKEQELAGEYKKELIAVGNLTVLYKGKKVSLITAIDQYILDVTKSLTAGTLTIGEIEF